MEPMIRMITAAIGEYFELPTELWVIFKDGTRMRTHVEWDGKEVDLTKAGTYTIETTVLEQTIKAVLTITDDRKVMGDDVSDVLVAARGGSYALPKTITQSIYLRASSGSYYASNERAPAYGIVWSEKPSTAVEDKYVLVGTVSNGTFEWKRTITLYVYSTYVNYIESLNKSKSLGTAAGESVATVDVGRIISPADLPEVNVIVYEGEAATRKTTAAKWYVLDGEGVRHELSTMNTGIAGNVYVLVGVITNRAGEEITYKNGEELRFTIKVNENVDLKTKYTVDEGANKFVFGETQHVRLSTDRDVKITAIDYYNANGLKVAGVIYDENGEPDGANTYPIDAGEYVAHVTLAGFGKVETVEIAYSVAKKKIDESEIVVIDLKQWDAGEEKAYTVSYGSAYNVPLDATYQIAEGATGTIKGGLPYGVGKYTVTIRVDSMNYEGEKTVTLEIVEYCTVTFMNGEVNEGSQKVEKGGYLKSPHRPAGANFLYWYLTDPEEPFDNLTTKITEDLTLHACFSETE